MVSELGENVSELTAFIDRYLFSEGIGSRYLPRGSNGSMLSRMIARNVFTAR